MDNSNPIDYQIVSDAQVPPPPSDDYVKSLDMFDNVLKEAIILSKRLAGIPSPSSRHFYSSVLFTSMVVRGVSLINLAPFSSWSSKEIEHWDYATCCNISRTMLENRLCFHYFCIEECTDEEWNCRWNILNLHDCTARIRLFTALNNIDQVDALSEQANELKDRLRNNVFFQCLKPGEQKTYLNGQKAYMQPLEEIAEKTGTPRETFRWMYTFLSSHVHSLPFSFYRMGLEDSERGRGLPSSVEVTYTSMCLSLCSSLLKGAIIELECLFKDIAPEPIENCQEAIEEVIPSEDTIGKTHTIFENEAIKIVVYVESETKIISTYLSARDNSVVLERVSENDSWVVTSIDPTFWRIDINGQPVTYKTLDEYLNSNVPSAHQVDHENLCFRIKTE